jgi:hypothetical protein
MQNFTIWYKNPKTREKVSKTMETPYSKRTITTIIEDELTNSSLKVPISPYIHPKGLQELSVLSCKHKNSSMGIAMLLCSLLRQREQENVVNVSYEELASFSAISVRTVASTIAFLEEHKFITRLGKQSYKISPKLAWFGNQVDWAIALQEEKLQCENQN